MKFTVIFALLALGAIAEDDSKTLNPKGCGKRLSDYSVSKISGGTVAAVGDFNWQAGIIYMGNHICGGTLINSQWIVTASHCLYGFLTPERYTITLGNHDRLDQESWAETRNVTKIVRHERYNPYYYEYNIALMKLETPVTYSKYISPVCVPTYTRTYAGQKAIATGWGRTKVNGEFSKELMQVELPVLTDSRCKDKFRKINPLYNPATEMCAGESNGGKGTCYGDLGGPLVIQHTDSEDSDRGQWNFIGIAAYYAYDCAEGSAFTRVTEYNDWILNKIQTN